jgi:hypothetical protein
MALGEEPYWFRSGENDELTNPAKLQVTLSIFRCLNFHWKRGFLHKKEARWWGRLGGKPVFHAASPRFVYRMMQFINSTQFFINGKQKITVSKKIVKYKK